MDTRELLPGGSLHHGIIERIVVTHEKNCKKELLAQKTNTQHF